MLIGYVEPQFLGTIGGDDTTSLPQQHTEKMNGNMNTDLHLQSMNENNNNNNNNNNSNNVNNNEKKQKNEMSQEETNMDEDNQTNATNSGVVSTATRRGRKRKNAK